MLEKKKGFPKELLKEVGWCYGGDKYSYIFSDMDEFNEKVRQYQQDIFQKQWNRDEVIIETSKIEISYECWEVIRDEEDKEHEDQIEKCVVLKSSNNEYFTAGEFFFKLHNSVVKDLKGMDHCFFEGLRLIGVSSDNIPLYDLCLGS